MIQFREGFVCVHALFSGKSSFKDLGVSAAETTLPICISAANAAKPHGMFILEAKLLEESLYTREHPRAAYS